MIEKENYIVDLINQLGGTATYESWEYNLDFLNEHLDEIKLLDDVNMEYVNAYIYDYTSLKESKKIQLKKYIQVNLCWQMVMITMLLSIMPDYM